MSRHVIRMLCLACAGAALLLPAQAAGFERLSGFGSAGSAAGQMSSPSGVVIGPLGLLYVADSGNNRIDVFDVSGSFVRSYGREAPVLEEADCTIIKDHCQTKDTGAAGVMSNPSDVAVDASGNVYVADKSNNRIDVFAADGSFLRAFGKAVSPAGGNVCTDATKCQRGVGDTTAGAVAAPSGIALDSGGLIYVATANYRVDVFTPQGDFTRSLGKSIEISQQPLDICRKLHICKEEEEAEAAGAMNVPSDVAVDDKGRVAIADPRNFRVDLFTTDGTFLKSFGKGVSPAGGDVCTAASGCRAGTSSAVAGGFASASAIAVNSGGIYVADTANNRIEESDFDGTFLRAFGEGVINGAAAFQVCTDASGCQAGLASSNPGSIAQPHGVAVDCAGALYAIEALGDKDGRTPRIERFGEPGTPSPPCVPPTPGGPSQQGAAGGGGSAGALGGNVAGPTRHTVKLSVKIELNSWDGTASVNVLVSDPGMLTLQGKTVRTAKQRAKQPGEVELLLQVKGKAKRQLQKARKLKVKALLGFEPDSGPSIRQPLSVLLKMGHRL